MTAIPLLPIAFAFDYDKCICVESNYIATARGKHQRILPFLSVVAFNRCEPIEEGISKM